MLGLMHKRPLFTMIKNADFSGSLHTNPYKFRQYGISEFSFDVNGKIVPSDVLTLDMHHYEASAMGYMIIFERSGLHL